MPCAWKHVASQTRQCNPVSSRSAFTASTYAAAASGYTCRLGHAGNGDAMLAYHLMDFSRYFFDQSDIRH